MPVNKERRRLHQHEQSLPEDSYIFPNIEKLVDNSANYKLLSFIDAYSNYNQIPMHKKDPNNVMPFVLKYVNVN